MRSSVKTESRWRVSFLTVGITSCGYEPVTVMTS